MGSRMAWELAHCLKKSEFGGFFAKQSKETSSLEGTRLEAVRQRKQVQGYEGKNAEA